jgi:hypothetical protein
MDVFASASGNATRAQLEYVRGFVGCSIFIYNYTDKNIFLNLTEASGEKSTKTNLLPSGGFIRLRCNLGYKAGLHALYGEFIFWEIITQGNAVKMSD